VVRFTTRLGYRGFADLQASVRTELSESLRPAAERIREPAAHDVVGLALHAELDNVRATLEGIDRKVFAEATRLLSRRAARVFVVSGEASAGVALLLRDHLSMLRPGVELLRGSPVRVVCDVATARAGDVLVAIDVRRYDRWVLEVVDRAAGIGMGVLALTDGPLSPLARRAAVAFTVASESGGPFDSHVGELALVNALLAGVAALLRAAAAQRLDVIESAWAGSGVLVRGRP
jgi:DNA-binding MurR/RpiR family transcriptional regulator